jgi:hypothetical protein
MTMAVAGKWKVYESAKKRLWDGTIDLDSNALKGALFLSTSNCNTLSVGTQIYGDLTNEHAGANGYTTGGVSLASVTANQSGGTGTFDAADFVWTAAGGSIVARFCVVYVNATVNTIVKPLICVCVFGGGSPADETATDGNTLTVQLNASGIFTLSGATTD